MQDATLKRQAEESQPQQGQVLNFEKEPPHSEQLFKSLLQYIIPLNTTYLHSERSRIFL